MVREKSWELLEADRSKKSSAFIFFFWPWWHFEDSIVDEGFDVDKIVQTQMMIEAVRDALSKLNDEEREIIDRLYFNDETIRSVAETKKISHPALIKRRNKILDKLRELLKDFR